MKTTKYQRQMPMTTLVKVTAQNVAAVEWRNIVRGHPLLVTTFMVARRLRSHQGYISS